MRTIQMMPPALVALAMTSSCGSSKDESVESPSGRALTCAVLRDTLGLGNRVGIEIQGVTVRDEESRSFLKDLNYSIDKVDSLSGLPGALLSSNSAATIFYYQGHGSAADLDERPIQFVGLSTEETGIGKTLFINSLPTAANPYYFALMSCCISAEEPGATNLITRLRGAGKVNPAYIGWRGSVGGSMTGFFNMTLFIASRGGNTLSTAFELAKTAAMGVMEAGIVREHSLALYELETQPVCRGDMNWTIDLSVQAQARIKAGTRCAPQ